ncbi:MAG TPA: BatA domain-containing protein [Isosphaeraceae bacterium]
MEFSLLNAGLAAGAALAVVPLILHLLMRQTPKHVIFPALRLIRERQKQSKKRLRVKNWLLLLARMALLALMALALARPSLHTEAAIGGEEVDTAIALVVDTSLSMEYTERGNDRLQEAKLRAGDILKKATDRSEVFVIDSADANRPPSASPAMARKLVEALKLRDANRKLNAAVVQAYAVVAASPLPRKEVYVLTDLAKSAWDFGSASVADAAKKANTPKMTINCYVLRLTPKEVQDVAVVAAEPASTVAIQNEPLEIKAKVRSWGPKTTRVAKLFLDKKPRGTQSIDLPENGEVEFSLFTPATLEPGLHQGEIRLEGGTDFMKFDDVRYFSFTVQSAQRVLIISDDQIDGIFTHKALEPDSDKLQPGIPQLVKVDRMAMTEFAEKGRGKLDRYAAVFLLNVARPAEADWGELIGYVKAGGGLVVAVGERAVPESYNNVVAAQLLPAKLETPHAMPANSFFAKPDLNHPLFSPYGREIDAKLAGVPVYRAWSVVPQASRTLLSFTDGATAAIERAFQGQKTGHVLLWVVPFRSDPFVANSWSDLTREWQFLAILLQSIAYLSGTAGDRLNYEAGEDALLPIDPTRRSANYTVQSVADPKLTERLGPPATSDKLVVTTPQTLGHWVVDGKAPDGSNIHMGFSINAPESEATVVPLDEKELVVLFGAKENVQLADDAKSLERVVSTQRVGHEIFPWIMLLILILVTIENLLANRFHREQAVPAVA